MMKRLGNVIIVLAVVASLIALYLQFGKKPVASVLSSSADNAKIEESGPPPSPEDLVQAKQELEKFKQAISQHDLKGLMELLAKDFGGGATGNKEQFRTVLESSDKGSGWPTDVDLTKAEAKAEKSLIRIVNVGIRFAEPMSIDVLYRKVDGKWLVMRLEPSA